MFDRKKTITYKDFSRLADRLESRNQPANFDSMKNELGNGVSNSKITLFLNKWRRFRDISLKNNSSPNKKFSSRFSANHSLRKNIRLDETHTKNILQDSSFKESNLKKSFSFESFIKKLSKEKKIIQKFFFALLLVREKRLKELETYHSFLSDIFDIKVKSDRLINTLKGDNSRQTFGLMLKFKRAKIVNRNSMDIIRSKLKNIDLLR